MILSSIELEHLSWTIERNAIKLKFKQGKSWTVISPQTYMIANVLKKAIHLLAKQGKVQAEDALKRSRVASIKRSSDGFFLSVAKKTQLRNTLLAAQRVSMAHHQAIVHIYGDEYIQMIGRTDVLEEEEEEAI